MSRSDAARVVVVGAGVGGLVSALLLAVRGLQVTLVEAAPGPGGKMRQVMVDGVALDAGPTVFTMRPVFDAVFEQAGARLDEALSLTPLSVLARHAWRGSEVTLDLLADAQASVDAVARFSGPEEARRYREFCGEARRLYDRLEAPAMFGPRPALGGMARDLGLAGLRELAALGPLASLWRRLGHHFRDPRLRQLFGRYATYCGASPWQAPATLMLIAHVELCGVWSVAGGMHALAQALAALAARHGVVQRYGVRCEAIEVEAGVVRGVRLAGDGALPADAVVFNGDTHALASGLLGRTVQKAVPPTARMRRSLSALTWAVHARTEGMALARHNVFFDEDYASEFEDIFQHRCLPRRGTVYVCAQDRHTGASTDAGPPGRERLLCLVNAPPDGDHSPLAEQEVHACLNRSRDLMAQCGLHLEPQAPQLVCGPTEFNRLFPATGGALYGPATHGWMSVFRRPGAVSALPGLFLAGGSVHPGPGVPMAALSGRQAAEAVMAHLDSTSRSRRGATSGGTSMPSATTADTA
jgi:1-hydroxycarotenoid 3,4-desaturase